MIDLIASVRPPADLDDYPNKVSLEEDFASAALHGNTCLWFDNSRPIAWAYVDDYRNLWWELGHQYDELLGTEIVEWGVACARRKLVEGETATLDTSCREDNAERLSFLDRHGFQRGEATTVRMARPLSEPILVPQLPQGFVIRPIAGVQEAEAVATMHRTAFGTEYMTTERRLAVMSTSEYDPTLDLLVLAPDGTIAGYCSCSVNQQKLTGQTDLVATHPRYQRIGLARALLLDGLRLLKERGMKSAHLGTSGDNIPMQRTAESVGFRVEYKTLWFSKEVG